MNTKELHELFIDCFKSYVAIKEETKTLSADTSAMFKNFATITLGDKKLKTKVVDYCRERRKLDLGKTLPAIVEARLDDLELNDSQKIDLDSIQQQFVSNEGKKAIFKDELSGVLDMFIAQTGRTPTEVKVFFSYMYQKYKKNYSPIDAIDEIKNLTVNNE